MTSIENVVFDYIQFGQGNLSAEDIETFCEKYPRAGACLKKWIKNEKEFSDGWFGGQDDAEEFMAQWEKDIFEVVVYLNEREYSEVVRAAEYYGWQLHGVGTTEPDYGFTIQGELGDIQCFRKEDDTVEMQSLNEVLFPWSVNDGVRVNDSIYSILVKKGVCFPRPLVSYKLEAAKEE